MESEAFTHLFWSPLLLVWLDLTGSHYKIFSSIHPETVGKKWKMNGMNVWMYGILSQICRILKLTHYCDLRETLSITQVIVHLAIWLICKTNTKKGLLTRPKLKWRQVQKTVSSLYPLFKCVCFPFRPRFWRSSILMQSLEFPLVTKGLPEYFIRFTLRCVNL